MAQIGVPANKSTPARYSFRSGSGSLAKFTRASALPKRLGGFEVRLIARQTDVSQTGLIEVPKFVARVTSPTPQSD
jgi:hypothetical protein